MRILIVATHIRVPDSHGGSTHVSELMENLRQHGSTMLIGRRGSKGKDVLAIGLCGRHPPPGTKHLLAASYFPRSFVAARRFKPDVVYERSSSFGLGMLLSRALEIPLLTMVLDEHYSPLSLKHARRIIATNLDCIPEAFRRKGVKVDWGANPDHFRADIDPAPARLRLGFSDDETVVGYAGSFQEWHGLEHLVEAAAKVTDQPLRYLLIGDGRCRPQIERRAEEAGVRRRFSFTGRVSYAEVPELLAAADCCVAPFDPAKHPSSERNGFALDPLKVFEYLAMAKPTITINSENLRKLFEDRKHLRMIPPADPEQLAQALRDFCTDPDEARRVAREGYRRVTERHTWAAHAAHLHEIFAEMLQEHRL